MSYMVFGWDYEEHDVNAELTEFVGTTSDLPDENEHSEVRKEIVKMPDSMLRGKKFDSHVLFTHFSGSTLPVLAFVRIGDKALD